MAQSNAILDTLEANLPSLNLYELKQLSVSELLNMLGGSKSRTVLNCMKQWHVKPRNYIEPEDITHYDNTGNYYHYVNGQRYYPTQWCLNYSSVTFCDTTFCWFYCIFCFQPFYIRYIYLLISFYTPRMSDTCDTTLFLVYLHWYYLLIWCHKHFYSVTYTDISDTRHSCGQDT